MHSRPATDPQGATVQHQHSGARIGIRVGGEGVQPLTRMAARNVVENDLTTVQLVRLA
jgi:hypothetical protein